MLLRFYGKQFTHFRTKGRSFGTRKFGRYIHEHMQERILRVFPEFIVEPISITKEIGFDIFMTVSMFMMKSLQDHVEMDKEKNVRFKKKYM